MQSVVSVDFKKGVTGMDTLEVTHLPISGIRIPNYQRLRTNRKAVERIANDFDPHLMRPIEVSYRNGVYYCWDGHHRIKGYIARGIDTIPCHVHYGLSYADEARLFASQQANVTRVQSYDIWNALVEAKDETAMDIIKCCADFGFSIHPFNKTNGTICAVKAIQESYAMLGRQGFRDVLFVLSSAWNGDKDSLIGDNIMGLSMFLNHYGMTRDDQINRVADVLKRMTPIGFIAKCNDYRVIKGGKARTAQTILAEYNRGLRDSNRLPFHQF